MKKPLLILLSAIVSGYTAQAQVTNPDTMVHRIFGSLNAKDEKAFVALYPNVQQMSRIMTKMFTGIKAEMAKKKAEALPENNTTDSSLLPFSNLDSIIVAELEKATSPESLAEMNTKFAKEFQTMMEKGEKRGIDWSKADMANYTYDTASVQDSNAVKALGVGYKSMNGVIHFKAGDSAYQLSFNEVMFIPEEGGWYGVRLSQLAREGEALKDDEIVTTEAELSDIERDDSTPPPPPAKRKVKNKSKTSSATKKTKVKS